ncbi:MAG: DUF4097 family beta strand repeat protein [Lachnospiraceae bacterium]|nr:DUF4097 family beta strand repeat protein [Lachnospiraceae bacterium]
MMIEWKREAGRGIFALLCAAALLMQSALPVYADTAEDGEAVSGEGIYSLEYFDRIAVNSISGRLTIRSGEEFAISFPNGWDETPGFSVQDEILVVSGRKNDAGAESTGGAVVLGEDEPAPESGESTAQGQSAEAEEAQAVTGEEPETVITIPAGVGLDTLRIAIKEGSLILEDITANSVTIQSGGGDMEMYNVSLGTVDIYSDIGAVAMSECTFNSINIGIGEGDVSVASGDSLERCRMELKTGTGNISYNGSSLGTQFMQPGSGKRFLTIQAGAGNIDISDQ